ncbi:MAG: hypothetical protein GC149_13390 [Gammaproteobacteria bacterium]|nr:hypothetical protein [Gammaproteobacteria bacterium]
MALNDLQEVIFAIQGLSANEYFPILWQHLQRFGFRFGEDNLVCDLTKAGYATCHSVDTVSLEDADIWFELQENQLIDFWYQRRKTMDVKVITTNPPRVPLNLQLLALRFFQQSFDKKYPLSDREELIYRALFAFKDPEVLWVSNEGVKALRYPEALKGYDVYVSSGFSNPSMKPAALQSEQYKIMGYGYELMLFAEPSAHFLRDIFKHNVQYICETKKHIMRDHWVRFDKTFPYHTQDLAGLVTVTPTWIPQYFPLQTGVVYWNLLVGVNETELGIAEKCGVEAGLLDIWDKQQRGDETKV